MITKLAQVSIIVRDQDEALQFYTKKLGLEKRADDSSMPGFRWLTVAPKGQTDVEIVLFQPGFFQDEAATKTLLDRVGESTHWVFQTDNCRKEYETLSSRGVKFVGPPEDQPWGVQAIFEDLYENQFVLLEPKGG